MTRGGWLLQDRPFRVKKKSFFFFKTDIMGKHFNKDPNVNPGDSGC